MHRTLLLSTLLLLFLGSWLLVDTAAQDAAQEAERRAAATAGRTVILIRHAEKGKDDPRNPSLSEPGEERAEALARVLGDAGVTHLFSTGYKRTMQTLAPLATARDLEVAEYSPRDMPGLLKRIQETPAASVSVIAGHSNTTPGVFKLLAGKDASGLDDHPRYGPMLPDDVYDRMFVVTLVEKDGKLECAASLEFRYGAE